MMWFRDGLGMCLEAVFTQCMFIRGGFKGGDGNY